MMTNFRFPAHRHVLARVFAAACFAAPLAACNSVDRSTPTASIPTDYRARHPIVLANAPQRLDIFAVGPTGALDRRQTEDVRTFALDYRAHGQGILSAMLPDQGGNDPRMQATLDAVRRELVRNGLHGSISVGTYPVTNSALASPIQLSFTKLEANVASRCGEWPEDLGAGPGSKGTQNQPYYNLGCAVQKNFAQQIDDPRDLVRGRAEEPSDVAMRTRAIGNIRTGTDPATQWTNHNTTISSVGAQ